LIRSRLLLSACAASALFAAGIAGATKLHAEPLLGFSTEGAVKERALEAQFDSHISATEQRDWLKLMAARPNHVGSPHDKANAEWMLARFKEWGWDARIETFDILYPTPIKISAELLGEHGYRLKLAEPPIAGDSSSTPAAEGALPPYVAYQGDGDVTAEVIYANYGMPEDYKALARQGIDVKGKIVLTRYGQGWRGLKPKLAYEHGAIGCLIYSDPADDGYAVDDVYPKGGTRPPFGVQRGSVQDMTTYPGDPLTPGVGATKDAKRLTRETATTILRIPALPISYADAQPILEAMGGPVAPKNFRGALGITYHIGPSASKLRLVVKSDWSLKPIYDVIGVMKGSEAPDQWVVRGNHHDGWVFGAWDPLAGNVALMNEAQALGAMAKGGWKPKRTIVYASWDAEEPGLIGSTEWAETHAAELQKNAVVYINSDTNGRGFLGVEGSHDLERMVNQTAADVKDPEKPVTVRQRQQAMLGVRAFSNATDAAVGRAAKRAETGGDLPIGALGSGSDYSAFLQHLGVPSINLGFGGEDEQGGIYHSVYDTFEHYVRFGDPKFEYGVALAQTSGRMVLREADAEVLPLQFGDFADTVEGYVGEVKKLLAESASHSEALSKLVTASAFDTAGDPAKVSLAPPSEDTPPKLDFTALDQAAGKLKAAANAYDAALAKAGTLSPAARKALNADLQNIDQALLDPEGLPGRPWFRNLAYAPGVLTGYGAKTLPGVREAIEGRRWAEAQTYVGKTAKALNAYAVRIERATAIVKKG
jgi:N-acetylated-alpha-linked acidic dipeptidase